MQLSGSCTSSGHPAGRGRRPRQLHLQSAHRAIPGPGGLTREPSVALAVDLPVMRPPARSSFMPPRDCMPQQAMSRYRRTSAADQTSTAPTPNSYRLPTQKAPIELVVHDVFRGGVTVHLWSSIVRVPIEHGAHRFSAWRSVLHHGRTGSTRRDLRQRDRRRWAADHAWTKVARLSTPGG